MIYNRKEEEKYPIFPILFHDVDKEIYMDILNTLIKRKYLILPKRYDKKNEQFKVYYHLLSQLLTNAINAYAKNCKVIWYTTHSDNQLTKLFNVSLENLKKIHFALEKEGLINIYKGNTYQGSTLIELNFDYFSNYTKKININTLHLYEVDKINIEDRLYSKFRDNDGNDLDVPTNNDQFIYDKKLIDNYLKLRKEYSVTYNLRDIKIKSNIITTYCHTAYKGDEYGKYYGRLYTSEQSIKKIYCPSIKFNDFDTNEADFGSYHLNMLYHLNGLTPKSYKNDLYRIKAVEKLLKENKFDRFIDLRQFQKDIANRSINCKNISGCAMSLRDSILSEMKNDIKLANKINKLFDDTKKLYYIIKKAIEIFYDYHQPIQHELFNTTPAAAKLQNIDSKIIKICINHLTKKNIFCIPKHDSIRVKECYIEYVRELMIKAYKAVLQTEYEPKITFEKPIHVVNDSYEEYNIDINDEIEEFNNIKLGEYDMNYDERELKKVMTQEEFERLLEDYSDISIDNFGGYPDVPEVKEHVINFRYNWFLKNGYFIGIDEEEDRMNFVISHILEEDRSLLEIPKDEHLDFVDLEGEEFVYSAPWDPIFNFYDFTLREIVPNGFDDIFNFRYEI
jgi:hypothetical protein